MMRPTRWMVSLAAVLFPALGSAAGFFIEHVSVLPMTREGTVIADATVVVRDGVIVDLGPTGKLHAPRGLRRIDGRGKWLMPGLSDMHVHLLNWGLIKLQMPQAKLPADFLRTEDVALPFIANGVTQIQDMGSLPELLQQRREIDSGAVLGPHYSLAGMVDGPHPVWPGVARVAASPEEGRRAVREIKAQGFDFVKVYSRLDLDTYHAILDEAQAQGIRVVGHLPDAGRGHPDAVLVRGLTMVAHAEEYAKYSPDFTDHDIERLLAPTLENHIWLTPTLITMHWIAGQTRDASVVAANPYLKYTHPALVAQWLHANRYVESATPKRVLLFQNIEDFNSRLVRAFAAAGVPILTGTDAIVPGVVYGFSLHDELEMLARAGMTNSQVLQSSTRLAAEFLRVADKRGTLEVGKAADMLLLDADPLADVSNTRRIAAVVVGGRYLSRAQLDGMMNNLAARFAAIKLPSQLGGT